MTTYLPSLPAMPGENETYQYIPPGRSIVDVLTEEHVKLSLMAAELADVRVPKRQQADRITAAMTRHLCAERQYLYPVVEKSYPEHGGDLADLQIDRDRTLLNDLAALHMVEPEIPAFRQSVQAIVAGWTLHANGCDADFFPRLLAATSKVDLIRLGNRAEIAREAAPSRPHGGAPMRPPWNKLTDAMLGAVDKVRDVVARRKTY